ncbi:MAG: hypothetical protein NZT92_10295 [Abditibacteriales bacterium]|nr:hypothetical protein [Abditibacteriales bacterium]MDW8366899.1 hypothetical protein [Abditibacteriales bacterium]
MPSLSVLSGDKARRAFEKAGWMDNPLRPLPSPHPLMSSLPPHPRPPRVNRKRQPALWLAGRGS